MGALARLAQQVLGAPVDHFLAERDEGRQHVGQRHLLGPAAIQGNHVGAEGRLQRREAVELVQDDVGRRIALQLDDDAVAVAVTLVANVGDALDPFLADQIGHLLDHRRLVDLERHLGDHDRLAIVAHRLDMRLAAHQDRAATGRIGRQDARTAQDDGAGGEVGPRNEAHQLFQRDRRIVDHRHAAIDDLAEIVRRDVRRHADGNAAGAVHQEVREPRRQDDRLLLATVVIVLEVDGFLVDVGEQRLRHLVETRLGVAHGRRRIAVDRAEIALPLDERRAQRPVLRHADQGVVDRGIAVRMVLTHHLTHDTGRLAVRSVEGQAHAVHRVEDAPVHRLQSVAHIGKRTADDHAHGVIEIAALHFLDDRDGIDAGGSLRRRRDVVFGQDCVPIDSKFVFCL